MIDIKKLKIIVLTMAIISHTNIANATYDFSNLRTDHEIVAKYEHGGKGYEAISKDNYGGSSYGKWQISTKKQKNGKSTFELFLLYMKSKNKVYYTLLQDAGGYNSAFNGEQKFKETWKRICNNSDFREIYDDFILNTQIIPTYERLAKTNDKNFNKVLKWGIENEVIQAAINSAIIQHGQYGCYKLIRRVVENNGITNEENFLKDLYRVRKTIHFRYKNRYEREYADLNKKLKTISA
jgi:hypothetical protein